MRIGPAAGFARARTAAASADDGFTMMEVVIALMLMMFVMTSSAGFFIRGMTATRALQNRQAATALAEEAMETARAAPAPVAQAPSPAVVGNKRYMVSTTVADCWVHPSGGPCDKPASPANTQMWLVTVLVTWTPGPSESCPPGCKYSVSTLRAGLSTVKNVKEVPRS